MLKSTVRLGRTARRVIFWMLNLKVLVRPLAIMKENEVEGIVERIFSVIGEVENAMNDDILERGSGTKGNSALLIFAPSHLDGPSAKTRSVDTFPFAEKRGSIIAMMMPGLC